MGSCAAFARGLQRTRKQRSLTQADLAEAAHLSVQMVAALEQGGKAPSMTTLDRLCEALHVRASEIFAAGESKATATDAPHERIVALVRDLPRRQQDELVGILARMRKLLLHARAR